jgi:hypothetical protein
MSKVLFIAPTSAKLNLSADLAAVGNGNQFEEVANGLLDRATIERLLRNSQAEILYLASDGDYGILQINAPNNDVDVLAESDIVQMMDSMPNLHLVVINACKSLGLAVEIHNAYHVDVVAMEAPIGDDAAITLARVFFSALRNKQTVEQAYRSALAAINRLYPNYAYVPRLINGDRMNEQQMADFMSEMRNQNAAFSQVLDALQQRVLHLEQAVNGNFPPPTTWHDWFSMGFSLLATLLLVLLLLRAA